MPDFLTSPEWLDHLEARRQYAEAVNRWVHSERLVSFLVKDCAESLKECAGHLEDVARNVRIASRKSKAGGN